MFKIYLIISLVCYVVMVNELNLMAKKAILKYKLDKKYGFHNIVFSSNGIKLMVLSLVPLFNVALALMFLFGSDKIFKETINDYRLPIENNQK